MKRLIFTRTWVPVLSAVLLAAGTLFMNDRFSPGSRGQETTHPTTRTAEPHGNVNRDDAQRIPFGRSTSAAPADIIGSAGHSETKRERVPADLPSVLEKNADIAEHRRLDRKALPTGEEREALREMLSDQSLIVAARDDLLASSESEYSKEAELRRMHRVKFFSNAIDWGDNPEMSAVTEAVEAVILADNIHDDHPLDLQRSLAGDKVELYWQLLHNAPEQAEKLAEHAKGTSHEALLTYAKERYEADMLAFETPGNVAP